MKKWVWHSGFTDKELPVSAESKQKLTKLRYTDTDLMLFANALLDELAIAPDDDTFDATVKKVFDDIRTAINTPEYAEMLLECGLV